MVVVNVPCTFWLLICTVFIDFFALISILSPRSLAISWAATTGCSLESAWHHPSSDLDNETFVSAVTNQMWSVGSIQPVSGNTSSPQRPKLQTNALPTSTNSSISVQGAKSETQPKTGLAFLLSKGSTTSKAPTTLQAKPSGDQAPILAGKDSTAAAEAESFLQNFPPAVSPLKHLATHVSMIAH